MSLRGLQELINESAPYAEIILAPARGEHEGPITINRPITLIGNGGTIWARRGPVVRVETPGVVLRDLSIEVTTYDDLEEKRDRTCLVVNARAGDLRLENVTVRGDVEGLAAENQEWDYPRTLRLPAIEFGRAAHFVLRIWAGSECRLRTDISGAEVTPAQLSAGPVEVTLKLEPLRPSTLLRGSLILETGSLTRRIELVGRSVEMDANSEVPEDGTLLFESNRWPADQRARPTDQRVRPTPAAVDDPRTGPAAVSDPAPAGPQVPENLGNWERVVRDPFLGPFLCPLPHDTPGVDPRTFGFPAAIMYLPPEPEEVNTTSEGGVQDGQERSASGH